MSEAHSGGWIGNTDQVFAGRALNLPASELRLAPQRLIAVGTVEFEFVSIHVPTFVSANLPRKVCRNYSILFADKLRLIW